MCRSIFFLMLLGLIQPLASARGFINSGAEWLAMPEAERVIYVRGMNDSANFVFADEGLDGAIAKVGRTKCLIEKQVSGTAMANMITEAYTKEEATFGNLSPLVVYLARVGQLCRDVINRQRAEFGLPLQ